MNLVKKVADDLLEFGTVQRAILGIRIGDVNAALSEQENLGVVQGVFVASVNEGSAAEEAGIQARDVIVGIDGSIVNNTSELTELVARHRPGDRISVRYIRDKEENEVVAVLGKPSDSMTMIERVASIEIDGSLFEEITFQEKENLGIASGVKLKDLQPGKWEDAGLKEGFIITEIDKYEVKSPEDLRVLMAHKNNERVVILGVFPDGTKSYYTVDW